MRGRALHLVNVWGSTRFIKRETGSQTATNVVEGNSARVTSAPELHSAGQIAGSVGSPSEGLLQFPVRFDPGICVRFGLKAQDCMVRAALGNDLDLVTRLTLTGQDHIRRHP